MPGIANEPSASESDHGLDAPVADNRRLAERLQCSLEVAVADRSRAFLPATVLDLSVRGVRLLVDPAPAPGDVINLTFLSRNGRLFQIRATVVHYVEHEQMWAVGCQFARNLADDEVAALL
jgi:hypothetical protein